MGVNPVTVAYNCPYYLSRNSSVNPDIARVPCNVRPKGRDVVAVPPQTGSATFVSSNIQFDKTSRAPAQGLESIGAVPEPLIAGVIADSCNKRVKCHGASLLAAREAGWMHACSGRGKGIGFSRFDYRPVH